MPREISNATVALRKAVDTFMEDFEAEYRRQATKSNRSSERRMRKLLRSFIDRAYIPYRDETLSSGSDNEF